MRDGEKLLAILEKNLAPLRGQLLPNFELGKATWFRTGGLAEVLFQPADLEDLITFLKAVPREIPVHVLGMGSNTLVRDGGVEGFVVRLSPKLFGTITLISSLRIRVGAGVPDKWLAAFALKNSLGGFHFYHGIPGSIGGALRMNAGANGCETSQLLVEVTALDRSGTLYTIDARDMGYSYRHCNLPQDLIFIHAVFEGQKENITTIKQAMEDVQYHRNHVQPVKEKTGGSTFKNPERHHAWKLIEEVGGRGFICGGAQMSPLHCNFMINFDNSTAYDLEKLGELMRARVLDQKKIALEWEIERIGEFEKEKKVNAFLRHFSN